MATIIGYNHSNFNDKCRYYNGSEKCLNKLYYYDVKSIVNSIILLGWGQCFLKKISPKLKTNEQTNKNKQKKDKSKKQTKTNKN